MVILHTHLPNLIHRGKVRDIYDLDDAHLLMVATDRISAFDVVLPNGIPHKGMVLAGLSAFWFQRTSHLIGNHLVRLASEAQGLENASLKKALTSIPPDIAPRSMVVKRAQRIDMECVVRGYMAGSAWAEYQHSGTIGGLPMPKGLREGDRFPVPIFTPTTKAEVGHDQNLSPQQVFQMVGEDVARHLKQESIGIYLFAHEYALQRGIIIADTKMEFGVIDDKLSLIDELFTPDSSRFWDRLHYLPGRSQPNFDKQFVRDWLIQSGWNREPPAPALPQDIVENTSQRYLEAYRVLTGHPLTVEQTQ